MATAVGIVPATDHNEYGHPENANRIQAIVNLLEDTDIFKQVSVIEPSLATESQLTLAHRPIMVERIRTICGLGGGHLDPDTYSTAASYDLARLAAGTTVQMAALVAEGQFDNGFAMIRPPGHHAEFSRVGGFCLFNNIALAARSLQQAQGLNQIAILDIDVHHGNGTQQIFYEDPSVLFLSMHQYGAGFYPGTGSAEQVGQGAGHGMTVNIPLPPGAGDETYALFFEEFIEAKLAQFAPEFILVSTGFDAHWIDPLALITLSLPGYAHICRRLIHLANDLCGGKILFVLEGGYHLQALSYGVLNLLHALLGEDVIQDPLGFSSHSEPDMTRILRIIQQTHLPS